ncbi:unnamed protein product [Sympodiomycopsis kandeliae]
MSPSTSGDPFGERGSLSAQDSNRTRFLGSASGVHFSKTVFSAFAPSIGGSFDQIFLAQDDGDEDDTESMASPGFFQGSPATDDHLYNDVDATSTNDTAALTNPRIRRPLSSRIPQRVVRLDRLPEKSQAIRFARNYFRAWHILFPFVDGKTFLHNLEALYHSQDAHNSSTSSETHPLTFNATLRVVLSLGQALDVDVSRNRDQSQQPFPDALRGSADAASYLPSILATARVDSVGAIQAVLSLQLYLLSTFRLRAAHQFGGIALRLALDAGLHRCPGRFHIFASSPLLVQMRKRIWHSALSLDRFISQQLGLPLGISESDHDVCPLGEPDAHTPPEGPSAHRRTLSKAVSQASASVAGSPANPDTSRKAESTTTTADEAAPNEETPFPQGGLESSCPSPRIQSRDGTYANSDTTNNEAAAPSNHQVSQPPHAPLFSPPGPRSRTEDNNRLPRRQDEQHKKECFAQHFTIVQQFNARAADLFNKNAAKRLIDPNSVMKLRSDVERWWNAFSSEPQVMEEPGNRQICTFLRLCYLTTNIGLERPMLALVPGTPAFSVAIQSAIRASRDLISTIHSEFTTRNKNTPPMPLLTVRWPGFLSATYQAALVLAYSTKVGELPVRLVAESLSKAIKVLEEFGGLWKVARPYASAVQVLHREITREGGSRSNTQEPPHKKRRQSANTASTTQPFFGGTRPLAANELFSNPAAGQPSDDISYAGYLPSYGSDVARRQFSASPAAAASPYGSTSYPNAYPHPDPRPYQSSSSGGSDRERGPSARPIAPSPGMAMGMRPDEYRSGSMAAPGTASSPTQQNWSSYSHPWPSPISSRRTGSTSEGFHQNHHVGETYHGQGGPETSELSTIPSIRTRENADGFEYSGGGTPSGTTSGGAGFMNEDDTLESWTSILSQVEAFLPPLRN